MEVHTSQQLVFRKLHKRPSQTKGSAGEMGGRSAGRLRCETARRRDGGRALRREHEAEGDGGRGRGRGSGRSPVGRQRHERKRERRRSTRWRTRARTMAAERRGETTKRMKTKTEEDNDDDEGRGPRRHVQMRQCRRRDACTAMQHRYVIQ